jgi:CRP/FNR family cyclic AMP-dependent transcriptional regulator
MHWSDFIGYLASILVVLTFYMDRMIALRVTAVLSNIAFLAYGISLELGPVVVLHGVLLPLNIWRLRQLRRTSASRYGGAAPTRKDPGTTRLSGDARSG